MFPFKYIHLYIALKRCNLFFLVRYFASLVLCSWLNKLREEMGLLGFHSTKAESVNGISAAVDALVSPRQAVNASSPVGIQSAQEV